MSEFLIIETVHAGKIVISETDRKFVYWHSWGPKIYSGITESEAMVMPGGKFEEARFPYIAYPWAQIKSIERTRQPIPEQVIACERAEREAKRILSASFDNRGFQREKQG